MFIIIIKLLCVYVCLIVLIVVVKRQTGAG